MASNATSLSTSGENLSVAKTDVIVDDAPLLANNCQIGAESHMENQQVGSKMNKIRSIGAQLRRSPPGPLNDDIPSQFLKRSPRCRPSFTRFSSHQHGHRSPETPKSTQKKPTTLHLELDKCEDEYSSPDSSVYSHRFAPITSNISFGHSSPLSSLITLTPRTPPTPSPQSPLSPHSPVSSQSPLSPLSPFIPLSPHPPLTTLPLLSPFPQKQHHDHFVITVMNRLHSYGERSAAVSDDSQTQLAENLIRTLLQLHSFPDHFFLSSLSIELENEKNLSAVMRERTVSVRVLQYIWSTLKTRKILRPYHSFIKKLKPDSLKKLMNPGILFFSFI
jgi:hypothetical protein